MIKSKKLNNLLNLINLVKYRCYATTELPRITLPVTLDEDGGLDLLKKKFRARRNKIFRGELFIKGDQRVPMITSKFKPKLNHYYNQRYRKGANIELASEGWLKGIKYDEDEIKFLPYEHNRIYKKIIKTESDNDIVTFESLGINEKLCKNLENQFQIYNPNNVQIQTIEKILSGVNVRCCFETGSGKTLAYALPLIELLLKEKNENLNTSSNDIESSIDNETKMKLPKILIIAPSRELAYQISQVFNNLTKDLNIGIATILGGKPIHLTHTGYDIVITTLGMFQSNLAKNIYSIDQIKHLVIDEVDTMCDSSFNKDLSKLLARFSFVNRDNMNACQLILVSATFPKYVDDVLGDFIDLRNIELAKSKKVNHLSFNLKHTFYRLNRYNRETKLIDLCSKYELDPGQTMIFVNRTPAASFIEQLLNSKDFECFSFIKQKGNADKRFFNFIDFQNGQFKFLVSTDLGSRGLDTRNVQHIINFDCPRFVADYVHRSGRTARINNPFSFCTVDTFISFKPDVYMLQNLEKSVRTGQEIDGIDTDIKSYYKTKYVDRELEDFDDEE